MAIFNSRRLAGAGYVVLNVIRAMNIIALLAVMAASSVMLVRTYINNNFFFFAAVEHVVRVAICGFLILSELPFFKNYWINNWPLLSQNSGFITLGAIMLLLGNSVLANLNDQSGSQEQLGMPFWRLSLASGIIIIVMSCVNILANFIFRDTTQSLTARQVRSDGATASYKAEVESTIAASTPKPSRRSRYRSFFLKTEDRSTLPSYHASDISRSNTTATQPGYAVSSPKQHFPVSPSSKYSCDSPRRPDLAHHPAMTARRE